MVCGFYVVQSPWISTETCNERKNDSVHDYENQRHHSFQQCARSFTEEDRVG